MVDIINILNIIGIAIAIAILLNSCIKHGIKKDSFSVQITLLFVLWLIAENLRFFAYISLNLIYLANLFHLYLMGTFPFLVTYRLLRRRQHVRT